MHILNESEWIHRQAEEVRKYNTLPNKDNKNLEYQQLHTKIYLCNDCGVLIHSFCVCVCAYQPVLLRVNVHRHPAVKCKHG